MSNYLSELWYQTHSNFIVLSETSELGTQLAVIEVDLTTSRIVSEEYTDETVKNAIERYLRCFYDNDTSSKTFEELVIAEITTMQKEYDAGESGELDVHSNFGQTTFYCDFEVS